MKKVLAIFCLCLTLAATSFDAEDAKRIGGGNSFGRTAPTFSQKAPAPAVAPKAPQQNSAAQQRPQQTTPAAAPAAKPSMMRSILTGMAAALGISALLSLLGIDSAGIASLLALGFMAQKRAGAQASGAAAAAQPMPQMPSEPKREAPAAYAAQPGARAGSVMDQFAGNGAQAQAAADGSVADITPADFDREGFLKVALDNYRKLQKAWDTGNVIKFPTSRRRTFVSRLRISCVNAVMRSITLKSSNSRMNCSALPKKAVFIWLPLSSRAAFRSATKWRFWTKSGRSKSRSKAKAAGSLPASSRISLKANRKILANPPLMRVFVYCFLRGAVFAKRETAPFFDLDETMADWALGDQKNPHEEERRNVLNHTMRAQ